MSTEIGTLHGNLGTIDITQYRSTEGIALQITSEHGYIQLSYADVYKLNIELTKWLKDVSQNKAQKLEQQIKGLTLVHKTLLNDAIDCSRFIQDLQCLEVPVRLLEITT